MRTKKKRSRGVEHHKQSLGEQIENPETYGVRTQPKRHRKGRDDSDPTATAAAAIVDVDEEELVDQAVPGTLSNRILKVAREQQEEILADDAGEDADVDGHARDVLAAAMQGLASGRRSDDDDNDVYSDPGSGGEWEEEWEEEVDGHDEAALAAFMNPDASKTPKTLSDVIMEKIREKQQQQQQREGGGEGNAEDGGGSHHGRIEDDLDPKVVEVYRGVGKILTRYSTGKVPKAFKVIPNLRNWEDILFLTEPELWSPHAVYQATRMFVSNLNARMAQRFLALVLLPAVRRDIHQNQRLHFALFQSLKKATYKPGAFYKGLLLPLCASGSCTLREAVIFTSVLRRASIPVMHSAAALLRIAEMPYSGVNSFFIRVLLDKRYALPYRVVDALVDHFSGFSKEERQLPVVWHQSLLCFVQRYKAEIRKEDKDVLRELCKAQHHYLVSPEVLRELDSSKSRGESNANTTNGTAAGPTANTNNNKIGVHVQENPRDLAPMILMDD